MTFRNISEQEKTERRAIIRTNLASQRMEGLEPDAQAVRDCEKWARGEITVGEAIESYKARLRATYADS